MREKGRNQPWFSCYKQYPGIDHVMYHYRHHGRTVSLSHHDTYGRQVRHGETVSLSRPWVDHHAFISTAQPHIDHVMSNYVINRWWGEKACSGHVIFT